MLDNGEWRIIKSEELLVSLAEKDSGFASQGQTCEFGEVLDGYIGENPECTPYQGDLTIFPWNCGPHVSGPLASSPLWDKQSTAISMSGQGGCFSPFSRWRYPATFEAGPLQCSSSRTAVDRRCVRQSLGPWQPRFWRPMRSSREPPPAPQR